jgi:hypothetical protein
MKETGQRRHPGDRSEIRVLRGTITPPVAANEISVRDRRENTVTATPCRNCGNTETYFETYFRRASRRFLAAHIALHFILQLDEGGSRRGDTERWRRLGRRVPVTGAIEFATSPAHGVPPGGNLPRVPARLQPPRARARRRRSTRRESELGSPTPALVDEQAALPAASLSYYRCKLRHARDLAFRSEWRR